jgi:AMP deaminase
MRSEADDIRIERYTAAVAPVDTTVTKLEQIPYASETGRHSPTSSLQTNASSSVVAVDNSQPYQQFPAQAARLRTSHSHVQLNVQDSPATGHHQQRPVSRDPTSESASGLTSPSLIAKENSWPVERFADRHISASEPRIFPGIVSRHHRRQSSVRKSSMSETDDHVNVVSLMKSGKPPIRKDLDSAVEEQEGDADIEEPELLDE